MSPRSFLTCPTPHVHLKQTEGHAGIQQQLRPPPAAVQTAGDGLRVQRLLGLGEDIKYPEFTGSKDDLEIPRDSAQALGDLTPKNTRDRQADTGACISTELYPSCQVW
jgi:hypothetical protein